MCNTLKIIYGLDLDYSDSSTLESLYILISSDIELRALI